MKWTSSDESVVTVDNAGNITAKKEGSAIITVVSEDENKKATCTVNVTNAKDSNSNNNNTNKDNNANNSNDNKNNNTNTANDNKNNNTNTSNGNKTNNDNTTAKNPIPQTGANYFVLAVIPIAIIIAIYLNKKKNEYKDIK